MEKEKEASAAAPTYPSQKKQILIMASLYLALFLVTLVPHASCPLRKLVLLI
jgi:hypothetical protein